ncbi:hypothetical protein TNCT_203581 [Trichonephila clavata]|uniref:Uncharacterized protein n=1 Tax=Trichonephila clavata TaxID=2740835 RepID=A0A8X6J018_TRICU|nr:hypothetical protein TNCT_203581 [Trichonephila clavata]
MIAPRSYTAVQGYIKGFFGDRIDVDSPRHKVPMECATMREQRVSKSSEVYVDRIHSSSVKELSKKALNGNLQDAIPTLRSFVSVHWLVRQRFQAHMGVMLFNVLLLFCSFSLLLRPIACNNDIYTNCILS